MVRAEESCANCGESASVKLACGHFYCMVCEGRHRDKCNPTVEVWDFSVNAWVQTTEGRRGDQSVYTVGSLTPPVGQKR